MPKIVDKPRQPYVKPQLKTHGDVTELTQGPPTLQITNGGGSGLSDAS